MKKTIVVLLTLALFACALLPACKRGTKQPQKIGRPGQTAAENEGETAAPEPKMLVNPGSFSERDVLDMGNYMNTGCFAEKDGWIYGFEYWNSKNGVLTKMLPDGTEQSKLSDTAPDYLAFMDDWLYSLAYDYSTGEFTIRRVKNSIEDEQIIVNAPEGNEELMSVFLGDGHVYYAVNDEKSSETVTGRLMRCEPDGGNPTVILNKPVYYPYFVGDSILFQDDNDGSTLHRCDPDGKNDKRILDCITYNYICDGKNIYYTTPVKADGSPGEIDSDDDQKNILRKCDLNGENIEDVIPDIHVGCFNLYKNTICYTNVDDQYKRYVYHLSDGSTQLLMPDTYVTQCWYLNNQIFYVRKNTSFTYIEKVARIDPDGSNLLTIYE